MAVAAAIATTLVTGACVSGPPLGGGQPLPVLLGEEYVLAVAASSDLIGAVPSLTALVDSAASVGHFEVEREMARVASVELALGPDGWLAVVRPKGRFPARFIGWTVSATEGFRYRQVGEVEPKLAYWWGNGIDIAVFEDAIVAAASAPGSNTAGEATGRVAFSPLVPIVKALREFSGEALRPATAALHFADLAKAIAMLATPEAAVTFASLLRVVPLTVVDLHVVVVNGNVDDGGGALEVVAALTVARPPASRYIPLMRLAIIPLLSELSLPATRIRGVEIAASDDDTAIELRRLMLSKEELMRIFSEMVQGAETAMVADG